ncbi:MAG: MFS transporter [Nanoarchaeota archaeon]
MVDIKKLKSNIWKFCFLRIFLRSLVFPVLVLYFLKSGLSATQVGMVFSIGIFSAFLLELPSGYISDKLGHKRAIIICFLMKAVAMLCYLGGSFWWFVVAEVLFIGGGSLWSGTGEAFFYETLKDLNRLKRFEKLYGQSTFISLIIGSVLLILIPFIYTYNNNLIFFLNFVLLLIPLIVSFTLEQPTYIKKVSKIEGWWGVVHEWRDIGRFVIKQKRYRAIIFFYAFWQAFQDAIDNFSQIFFTFVKIPVQFFGAIYSANRILYGLGGQVAYIFKRTLNVLQLFAMFSLELILFFFFGAFANAYTGALVFLVRNFFEGVSEPISSGQVNKEITKGNRITLLSVEPTLARLVQGVLVLIMGVLFDTFSVPHVFIIMGIALIFILSTLYFMATRAISSKEK